MLDEELRIVGLPSLPISVATLSCWWQVGVGIIASIDVVVFVGGGVDEAKQTHNSHCKCSSLAGAT